MRRLGLLHFRAGHRPTFIALALSIALAARTGLTQQPVQQPAQQAFQQPAPQSLEFGPPGSGPSTPADAALEAPFTRRQIFVGLPTSKENANGQLFLAPNVNIGSSVTNGPAPGQSIFRQSAAADDVTSQVLQANAEQNSGPLAPGSILGPSEMLPGPDAMFSQGETTPIFSEMIAQPAPAPITGWRAWLMSKRPTGTGGLGRERLAFAPFEIDVSAPNPSMRARFVSVRGAQYPDRAEYLWAKIGGRGPKLAESGLDYQEGRFQMELGSKRFSTATEIPIRFSDPDVNPNHTSIGDMNLTVKTVLLDGKAWQITQLFRSFFPTGSPSMGLGTGHVSFEPGFLARYNSCDTTYFHGQFKYFFPVGGDRAFQGQVVTYGVGVSHILLDSDDFTVLPVLEFVGNYIANGQRTEPNGTVANAEGDHVMALYPGFRVARDRGSDLGLLEWGMSMGLPITGPRFYDSIFRFDFRVHF